MSSAVVQSLPRQLTPVEIARFRRDGFLSISEVTTPEDIAHLRRVIDVLFESSGQPFGVIDHMLKLVPAIRQTLTFRSCRRIARQLAGLTACASFDQALYKRPHELHGTQWHQDQAFRKWLIPMNTLHFWVPLQSVTAENGCLHFIPVSHQQGLRPHYRARENDRYAITTYEVDTSRAVACPLPIGSATVHLPLTLHSALPNNTEDIRRAWALLFRPFGRLGSLNLIPWLTQYRTLRRVPV